MPRTTIADVAQAAGVSVSTVSRALRGLDRVSPETRERIEQEAKRLHFSFSKSASSLASGKTMRVAVLLPNEISSWFNAHAFEGIYEVMSKAGYDIVPYIVWTRSDHSGGRHERAEHARSRRRRRHRRRGFHGDDCTVPQIVRA